MSRIAIVGEAYGAEEEKLGHAFVGPAGRELVSMLWEAGVFPERPPRVFKPEEVRDFWLTQRTVTLHNVLNLRPPNNDIDALCGTKREDSTGLPPLRPAKYLRQEYVGELDRLAHELSDASPNIVIGLGNTPLWALARSSAISKVRGAIGTESLTGRSFKFLPTYHPAAVLRQWDLRPITIIDLAKAGRESLFREVRRPERTIFIDPTLADLEDFYDRYIQDCRLLSFDIETSGNQITCIGFAPSPTVALVIPFVDSRREGRNYWPTLTAERAAWDFVRRVLGSPIPKVAQNGLYDTQFLWRSVGIPTRNMIHDTMLLHHALQPESQKGLGFLGSVYTNEASWKLMRSETVKRDE